MGVPILGVDRFRWQAILAMIRSICHLLFLGTMNTIPCPRKYLLLAVAALVLSGCGGHEVVRPTVSVSIGQQLIDLKAAHDSGALTRSEFESQRRQLIDSVE